MKPGYVAAAGPPDALRALEARVAAQSRSPLAGPIRIGQVSLWTEQGASIMTDKRASAVLVGRLFDRASGTSRTALPSAPDLEAAVLRDCWGPFVLVAGDEVSHSILRDPSGAIPVYYGSADGLEIYGSDSAMLGIAWPEPFRPDLDTVREWLSFPFLRTARTGAAGISELIPGMSRRVDPAGTRLVQCWSPIEVAKAPVTSCFREAAALLRETILMTVAAVASGEESLVLRLSGGLDSSIVAAAAAEAGARCTAVTFATRSTDGDERRYARLVASRFGMEVREIAEADIDLSFRAASDPFRPPPSPLLQPLRRAFAAAAAGAGMVLDGAGGDNVFASLNSGAPALDALRDGGLAQAIRTLHDLAAVHGCTFWTAARAAARRWKRGTPPPWPGDRTFLGAGALVDSGHHPWLDGRGTIAEGSADHIRTLTGIHHFFSDPRRGEPYSLHPLIAQPVLEACLRLPSWLWVAGGRDRAVARAAFRGLVPDAILDRRSKGSLESMFLREYMERRSELRELLCRGCLAAEGIIEREAVSRQLDEPSIPKGTSYIRILEIAGAEQWLRSFANLPHSRPRRA